MTGRAINRSDKKKRITAYHEAGHAVIGIVLGFGFDYVTIIPNDDCAGHCVHAQPRKIVKAWGSGERLGNAQVTQWVEHECIVSTAGHLAQRKAFPRHRWRQGFGLREPRSGELETWSRLSIEVGLARIPKSVAAPGSDLDRIARLLIDLHRGDADVAVEHHAYLRARAEALIEAQWPNIEKVAAALLDHKRLSADEVRAVMSPAVSKTRRRRESRHISRHL
jgi:hypothetical protein